MKPCFRLGIVIAMGVVSMSSHAAPSSSEDMRDRLQNERLQREQRRLDDAVLPGDIDSPQQGEAIPSSDGPCFDITSLSIISLGKENQYLLRALQTQLPDGGCYDVAAIQTLQRRLSNWLTRHGYVTSRVLLPEQTLASGQLKLVLVAGHIDDVHADGLSEKLARMALPNKEGALVNLRDLEQGIENLNRVQGVDASFDLAPGKEMGDTRIDVKGTRSRPVRASLLVDETQYGSHVHGTARVMAEIGSPSGFTDRLIIAANTDLDQEVSDTAWGGSIDYDIGVGYWLFAANSSYHAYRNDVQGVNQTFEASGVTQNSRVDVSRVVQRSNVQRVTLGGYVGYSDIRNLLDSGTISVSSYDLRMAAVRFDFTRLWRRYQFASTVTLEQAKASGPATNLPNGLVVADEEHLRALFYSSALRTFSFLRSSVQWRLNGQYSNDVLFSAERFSVTALVRGYDDIGVGGNSGLTSTFEYSINPILGNGAVAVRPYIATDIGWVPGNENEFGFVRLASATLGTALSYRSVGGAFEISSPIKGISTQDSGNDYVVQLNISVAY